jgi:hypothetical protein
MHVVRTVAALAAVGLAGSAVGQPAPPAPVATYWMSAQTSSGFTLGAGGGKPSAKQMMGLMMGGGGGGGSSYSHALTLQLGSQRRAQGEPQAEHVPPAGLDAGASLPLVTPRQAAAVERDETPQMPREYQRPKGRMLIYWGCGDHARPGQPVVIDFAQVAKGAIPPGLAALNHGLGVTPLRPPSPSRSATYGEWPNEHGRTSIPAGGSLAGDHVVRGNYTPDIHFSLGADQDFLPPLKITTNQTTPAGSSMLAWRSVDGADAYLATLMGGGRNDTVVMWTSSEVQASSFAMPDYLSGADIARLVGARALMGKQTTSCVIPKEVVEAVGGGLLQLVAYAKDVNVSYPPRPSNPRTPWKPEWTLKVRYRSATGAMLGMSGMGEDGPQGRNGQPQQQQPRRPSAGSLLKGLGGF